MFILFISFRFVSFLFVLSVEFRSVCRIFLCCAKNTWDEIYTDDAAAVGFVFVLPGFVCCRCQSGYFTSDPENMLIYLRENMYALHSILIKLNNNDAPVCEQASRIATHYVTRNQFCSLSLSLATVLLFLFVYSACLHEFSMFDGWIIVPVSISGNPQLYPRK